MGNLMKSIREHEGFVSKPYPDPIHGWDVPTFGIGFTYITEKEANMILAGRVLSIRENLLRVNSIFSVISRPAQNVIIEMAFQLGVGGVGKFKKMWQALSFRDYAKAADEMLDSHWAKQTPERANTLAERMRAA